jgi:hypothetical protein
MTMEDVPGKRGPGSIIIEDNEIYQNNLVGIRIRGSLEKRESDLIHRPRPY